MSQKNSLGKNYLFCGFYLLLQDVASQFNDSACKGKVSLKEVEQLRHLSNMKSTAANKATSKYKKIKAVSNGTIT